MVGIKRLYTFILQTFLPLFIMTFGICLFIILMQFLWKYIDEMVGKGIDLRLLMEMFFYAALSLVPMALPLSILLASLMTFGNLGESFELTAIKASGVSLLKTMKPIIFVIAFVAIGAYYFQNNVMPYSQVKLYTLLYSMRQKSPELDIPEGSFYKEIPNYNLYVSKKSRSTGIMYDMMIYDFSKGFENASVTVADSGRLKMSSDKKNLMLILHNGESFQNLREQSYGQQNKSIAYQRETFSLKEVFIEFDSNFTMMDESVMQSQYIGKNKDELRQYIDSVSIVSDSVNHELGTQLRMNSYMQSLRNKSWQSNHQTDTLVITSFDSFFAKQTDADKLSIVSSAQSKSENIKSDYLFKSMTQGEQRANIIRHKMELNRKYTLSFACLVFLFIGAPLGAIIRKGGLGMPVVVSILLFLFYYTIDTFGIKMARQAIWPVWQGMWLSSAILFPLGTFLTYKAVNDSIIFNPDTYINAFKRLLGKRDTRKYELKEVVMHNPNYVQCQQELSKLSALCSGYLQNYAQVPNYLQFWQIDFAQIQLKNINTQLEWVVEELRNADSNLLVGKLMDYPIISLLRSEWLNQKTYKNACAWFFPLGLLCYGIGLHKIKRRKQDMQLIIRVSAEIKKEINHYEQNKKDD